mmetsp:Transcript_34755/g.31316  ORF Transcript_34755/g.31316 Transcript_34755/m.31316 type:complete len:122 (+) Transcript_34755:385-750(+)
MYINERNFQDALQCFEHIVKNCHDGEIGECYRLLGYIYTKKGLKDEAADVYDKAIKFDEKDYECMLEYANFLEGIDSKKALELYKKSVFIIKEFNQRNKEFPDRKPINIHPEIIMNMAVLN